MRKLYPFHQALSSSSCESLPTSKLLALRSSSTIGRTQSCPVRRRESPHLSRRCHLHLRRRWQSRHEIERHHLLYGANSASLEETDLSGNFQRAYYFFDGQRVARQLITNEVGFYMTDHLGNVRYLGGSATGYNIEYYPFGGVILNSDTGDDRYQFTGKERDSESTLDNFGARYFSSSMGRFMSPDPDNAGAIDEDPQSWNGYAYARNNPLRYTDPDGLDYKVCVDNGNGGQNCTKYDNYDDFPKAANASGATLSGNDKNGQISVNGNSVGTYSFFPDPGTAPEENFLAPALFGGLVGGIRAGIRGLAEAIFGGGAKTAVEQTAGAAAEQVIAAGTKNAVKQALEDAAISDGQKQP
jgi:RHS repeat-associated protein